jgi:hypothetical protein
VADEHRTPPLNQRLIAEQFMSDAALELAEAPAPVAKSRTTLLKRLADVVCLPSSRVNTFERSMTADLLVEMLREAHAGRAGAGAKRLCQLVEIPNTCCACCWWTTSRWRGRCWRRATRSPTPTWCTAC